MKTRVDVKVTVTGQRGSGKTKVSKAIAAVIYKHLERQLTKATPLDFKIYTNLPTEIEQEMQGQDDFTLYVEFEKQ